ncbi:PREDICTED: uncharacterized protein LOC101292636 [Fragaria vesca subsp. vesca]|uniref:uncharacterized protein LOC101292636 n=1 Tax=Fragaria vesca subsp. vesca TaxID=101020 RepID=UPI0002C2EE66|nr:PREDICTED: uncharacterized protein LOC101292636 [Fragaria vesca subsp. vesca]
MADFTLLDSETEIEASRGTSRTRGNMSEGSSIEGPQRTRLLQHLKDLHEENKTLMKLVADKDKRIESYMIDFEELNSLKIIVNKLEKQNFKLTQANTQMLLELRSLRNHAHKVQHSNLRPIQETIQVQEVQQPNLQPAQEVIQVNEIQQPNLQPAQARIHVQEFEPPNMQAGQATIQMQEEEPVLENSQIFLELRSNVDMLSSTDEAVRECIHMIEQLQASGPPTDEAIQQVKAKLQALGPITIDAVRQIRAGFRKLQKLQCPRCESNNTKFSVLKAKRIAGPRYHCKNCKMEWTLGGKIKKPIVLGGVNRKDLLQQRVQRVQRRRMKN